MKKGSPWASCVKARCPLPRRCPRALSFSFLPLDIRNHILTGRIDEATELLHKHFPTVLSDTPEPGAIPPSIYLFKYRPATSTDPTHLALNLRIQAFIEAARTIPLPYYPPGSESPLPQPPLLSAAGRSASSGDGEDVDMSESDTELSNAQLLHRAQSLYSEVNRLSQANDRAMYLGELGQVGGILAYTVPERSPLAMYMTQARREAVADQIDSAILCEFITCRGLFVYIERMFAFQTGPRSQRYPVSSCIPDKRV